MLSRHAESLFWVGRYIERVTATSRMLDVTYQRQLEDSNVARQRAWADLIEALYLTEEFDVDHEFVAEDVLRFLISDRRNPSSIITALANARTNLLNVRDVAPVELLEAVNRFHRLVAGSEPSGATFWEFSDQLKVHSHIVSGTITDRMARTDGFRFLIAGRLLERAEMTCRLIDVQRVRQAHTFETWERVLRSTSGFQPFTDRYGAAGTSDEAVSWLLTADDVPCGVLFCLRSAEQQLAAALPSDGLAKAPRRLGRVRAWLQFVEVPGVADPALETMLEELQEGIRHASETLHRDLFETGGEPLSSYQAV